ncbi:MAG: cryptochrome/photolyase family protein [Candidatus Doudnabacteria bacterium]|nr:cryptochrome/photolyase family protein [Candidatus Doudnabacteria bacterium]
MHLVILPNQLYELKYLPAGTKSVHLLEHPYFFEHPNREIRYHKQKLILHRASMQAYHDLLCKHGIKPHYHELNELSRENCLEDFIKQENIKELAYFDPTDRYLQNEFITTSQKLGIHTERVPTPNFLTPINEIELLFQGVENYSFSEFYTWQRKRLNLLLDSSGKPLGGKWMFESAGSAKIPSSLEIPKLPKMKASNYVEQATTHVEREFPNNPGRSEDFIYPVTHKQAQDWLAEFVNSRFGNYAQYLDSIWQNGQFLFHGVLSPLLNIGLLSPQDVVEAVMARFKKEPKMLQNAEAALRQIIGWREFIRAIYITCGDRQRSINHWHHHHDLPQQVWQANTGIHPVDICLDRVTNHAYTHHAERLMVLGNWMTLCEIHPQDIYNWFMSMFIDAYDWAVVPNVFGLSQQSDGGIMGSKPHISGSAYIRKVSNYKAADWCDLWDSLFWRYIYTHKEMIANTPRLRVITTQLARIPKPRLQKHIEAAEKYLHSLYSSTTSAAHGQLKLGSE